MPDGGPTILVLGANGMIGSFVAGDLMRRGMAVVAAARGFTGAQRRQFGNAVREVPLAGPGGDALARLLDESGADVVVNCLGVLQDSPAGTTRGIHLDFVGRLLAELRALKRPVLLVQMSMPGAAADDRTGFARSKRAAEQAIAQSGVAHAILRPGFVVAPAAFGGSALVRALVALPFDLPDRLARRPFATVAVEDVAETVAMLANDWRRSGGAKAECWDMMHPQVRSLGDALGSLRAWLGTASPWRFRLPYALLTIGARAGDIASWLGWRPPVRSTAVEELQRGVTGDPRAWMQATGIAPRSLDDILQAHPATVQEKWFARLYLLKPLIIVVLAAFWCVSALIVLTVAYPAAVGILTARGYAEGPAQVMTVAGSVMDFAVGIAILFRRTCRPGLLAGIAVSLFYMIAAAVLTPDLWVEPLGALVKTGPAIVLMLVALAIADDR